jgi:hypothetical protein
MDGFDASKVEPEVGFGTIPQGQYNALIVGTERRTTKAGDGSYLSIEFRLVGGEYEGRRLWTRLNLANPNDAAVRMARGELSAICRAVGILTPRDSSEFHNQRIVLCINRKKGADGVYENVIRGYLPNPNDIAI